MSVEMSIARLRALTLSTVVGDNQCLNCRNEYRPIEGIDTELYSSLLDAFGFVEMSIARLRALTCTTNNSECMKV